MELSLQQLIERGRQAFQSRDYVTALGDFREVLGERPEFADVHNLAGLCLSFMGQPENALESFDRALALNEGYVEAHLNRAITLNELNRYDEARKSFERASHYENATGGRLPSAVTAQIANAHAAVGDLYQDAGAYQEAAEQYRIALKLRAEFLDIRNRLAEALMRLGRYDAAEDELRTALDGNPRFLLARLNLGLVHYYRNEHAKARAQWEQAEQQAPSHAQVRAYLSLIREAEQRA